jgi:acyl-CoA reductase-like NAD-dependent aldehyde dehydrogenase
MMCGRPATVNGGAHAVEAPGQPRAIGFAPRAKITTRKAYSWPRRPAGSRSATLEPGRGAGSVAAMQSESRTLRSQPLLLDGAWTETGDWLEVRSPYSGEVVARVARGRADDARRAVDAAARALAEPVPAHERAAILDRAAHALDERREEAAQTICAEAGKPISAARVEAARGVSTLTYAAVAARTLGGEIVPMEGSAAGAGKLGLTLRKPIGVVGAVSPFNFPLNLVAHKVAPSIAAGCPVVLKPASQTPCSALLLAEVLADAGLPAGWLNVLPGPASEIGDVLVEDERVRLLTFTGSGSVGWGLRERAPKKKVLLELGNSTPAIVLADAAIGDVARKLAANGFSYAGQSCISVQRVYVEQSVYDEFVAAFVPAVEALVAGDPARDETHVGPLIDRANHDRVLEWIEEARADGAEILTGGEAADEGRVIRPTVIARPPADAKVVCEEVFGPVVTVTPVDSLDDAIAQANATRYGLQAGIFTRDLGNALRAARELDFGGVTVNEAPTFRADQMPYGGVKDSGNTKEGPPWAIRELTEECLVVLDLG